jgi:hypothetical protein
MSSPQDRYADVMRSNQEALLGAVESWTKNLQNTFTGAMAPAVSADPNQVIDQVFDFAEKMLEVQREFAKNLASASAAATGAVRQQAESAGEAVRQQPGAAGGRQRGQAGSSYEEMTKPELQEELGRRGLTKSGNVAELRRRLRDDDQK